VKKGTDKKESNIANGTRTMRPRSARSSRNSTPIAAREFEGHAAVVSPAGPRGIYAQPGAAFQTGVGSLVWSARTQLMQSGALEISRAYE